MNSFGAEEEGSTNKRSHCFPKGKSRAVQPFERDRYSDCFPMETYIERGRDWPTKIL